MFGVFTFTLTNFLAKILFFFSRGYRRGWGGGGGVGEKEEGCTKE